MKSEAKRVESYLQELLPERRKALATVHSEIRKNLPEGFEERMNWGRISYQVPLKRYLNTYNGQPLLYSALASQRNHMAVYLSALYSDSALRKRFENAYRFVSNCRLFLHSLHAFKYSLQPGSAVSPLKKVA